MNASSQITAEAPLEAAPEPPLLARADERLDRQQPQAHWRFLAVLAFCLVGHLALMAFLIFEDWISPPIAPPDQEISVEVVPEQALAKAEEPLPSPPEPQPEKKAQQEPPKQQLTLDEKVAYDAPRAENKETVKREAPDEATRAQNRARPNEETAPTPAPKLEKRQQERAPQLEQEPGEPASAQGEDRPDAEVIEQAAPSPNPTPDKKPAKSETRAALGERQKSIAEMIASLEPTPEFKLGGSAKSAPISGGTASPSYLSVVLGYIKRQYRPVGGQRTAKGVISFYVDPDGHLVHQALRQSSGSAALDQAAMAALRRAGPFPPTPTATALGIFWEY